MPLGFERLNERQKRPNEFINFIKPLDGPDRPLSQDFLERVAAISYPIMKANHIAVMSLEEYPANPEFAGRNFNAGEVIQLVLKAPSRGSGEGTWLPFRHVQMVMMHELAHCKQMNHSGFFWKVRNGYAKELRDLWERKYTGEGFWSRGQTLLSGKYTHDAVPDANFQPRSLCGGTFRSSRKRKRKRKTERGGEGKQAEKPKVSYAERKQRRILKKFGAGGTVLGDADAAVKAEGLQGMGRGGGKSKGKPRVASSRRGRELRAAAALARFEQAKDSSDSVKEEDFSDSDTSVTEDESSSTAMKPATDLNGKKLTDYKGFGLIKVCEGEQENDENVKREMEELRDVDESGGSPAIPDYSRPQRSNQQVKIKTENDILSEEQAPSALSINDIPEISQQLDPHTSRTKLKAMSNRWTKPQTPPIRSECSACSLVNEADSVVCCACSNVLDIDKKQDYWHCQSTTCRGGSYINPGYFAACGVCGAAKC